MVVEAAAVFILECAMLLVEIAGRGGGKTSHKRACTCDGILLFAAAVEIAATRPLRGREGEYADVGRPQRILGAEMHEAARNVERRTVDKSNFCGGGGGEWVSVLPLREVGGVMGI